MTAKAKAFWTTVTSMKKLHPTVIVQLQILINHMKQVAVVGGGGLRHQIAVSHLGRNA